MSALVSAMRFVGDLDNEFYHDEHQRDVWNEASAIGFQLSLWTAAIAMAILPWIAGETGSWIAIGLFVAISLISILTLSYSKSRRVDVQSQTKFGQPRALAITVLIVVAGAGVLIQRSSSNPSGQVDASTLFGAAVGGVIGAGTAAFFAHRANKKRRELDAIDDDL